MSEQQFTRFVDDMATRLQRIFGHLDEACRHPDPWNKGGGGYEAYIETKKALEKVQALQQQGQ